MRGQSLGDNFLGGNNPGDSHPGSNCLGEIIRVAIFLGRNFLDTLKTVLRPKSFSEITLTFREFIFKEIIHLIMHKSLIIFFKY